MNPMKKLKKITQALLAAALLMLLTATFALAATPGEVNIRFAAYNGATGAFLITPQNITVPQGIAADNGFNNAAPGYEVGGVDHGVPEGEITALDALVAAHLENLGDTSAIIGNESYITGMFGIEGNIGFSANGIMPIGEMSDGYAINEYILKEGETILFFSYTDDMWSDYTSYFDVREITADPGEEFGLTLQGYQAMEKMMYPAGSPTPGIMTLTPVSGAEICLVKADGSLEQTGQFTDGDGKVTLSFEQPGSYIISARGTVFDNTYGMDVQIVAPLCFVTVGSTQAPEPEPEPEPVPAYRLIIDAKTNNGSLDCVDFKNADGEPLENAELSITDNTINVTLPKDYSISGNVTAEFTLTQNSDGLPYVTPKNGASGTSSGKAWNQRKNTYTTTLLSGKGAQTVYFYNHIPRATTNTYDTYVINYKIKNELPTLADGISSTAKAEAVADIPYTVNLDRIFTDADGDTLTYKTAIGDESPVGTDAEYSFTPELGGEYILTFTANDRKEDSEQTYTVTLTVTNSSVTYTSQILIPDGITPSFYVTNGFNKDSSDIPGDELIYESGDSIDGFTAYTLNIPQNIEAVSVRARKDETEIGGMSVQVSEGACVSFREVRVYLTTKSDGSYVTYEQVKLDVSDTDGHFAVPGSYGTDSDGILYRTFLLAATGNEKLYTIHAVPLGTLSTVYAKLTANDKAIPADTAGIYETAAELGYKSAFRLNVPADAEAKAFYQNKYYNTSELSPLEIKDEQDGTKTYYFHVSAGSDAYSYRVSSEGKITKAGYISGTEKKVAWGDSEPAPDTRAEYDRSTTFGARGDDSLLLNVNPQNRLVLENGNTFRLRAYRIWQIINNDTMNRMIEPDFTCNILSGSDVVSIAPVNEGNGNAKNNRLDITATGEGTAIIEIGYDAIDIISGNLGSFNALDKFTFNACDEARTGLVIVQTTLAAEDIDFGIKSKDAWDSEFDTLYFTGEYATLRFSPTCTEGAVAKVEFSNDKGVTFTEITPRDGEYSARIISGNNILKITKDDGTSSYQVVRGYKTEVKITNAENSEAPICAGDTARVSLEDIHFPMGKMSGLYNPGYGHGHKLSYTLGTQQILAEGLYQYDFPANAYIDVKIPEDAKAGDTITLTDGYICFNNMGSPAGAHRSITDSGLSTNMSAPSALHSRCILPQITITVESNTDNEENSGSSGEDGESSDGNTGSAPSGKPSGSIDVSDLEFDLDDKDIKGYVTVSFTDNGKRKSGESAVVYKKALGEIIKQVEVPYAARDTVAAVTLRLLDALDIDASYAGSATNGFYLSSIGGFTLGGKYYSSFGEFDSGAASGWMVKHNGWFINMGASEFAVQDGDTIEWLYTCRLGADIGCDASNPSAELVGLDFQTNGKLSPAFDADTDEYTYTVSSSVKSVRLVAELENYWSKVTYTCNDETYRPGEAIPISDGSVITIESSYAKQAGDKPSDTDSITITVKKRSSGKGSADSAQKDNDKEETTEKTPEEKPADDELTKDTEKEKDTESEKDAEAKPEDKTENKPHPFADTANHWAKEAVEYVYSGSIMQGDGNGNFKPDDDMTRAMLVTVLYRLEKAEPLSKQPKFSDIPNGQWYTDAVVWASENGIVNGISETEFAPSAAITREQAATILYRYAKLKGYDTDNHSTLSEFQDATEISAWALEALKWANAAGLVNGTGESTVSPAASATRAQLATILMRFCKNTVK